MSTRKIVPNPGVAKYQFVAAPKAVKVKNAKFADSSTGIDEEIMQTCGEYLHNRASDAPHAEDLKKELEGGGLTPATTEPRVLDGMKGPRIPLAANTSSQDSSLMQLSPPQTPSYGLGMFALKKKSMLTRRNLLQKLDNDFQAPHMFATDLQNSKLNVDICLGLNYSPRLK